MSSGVSLRVWLATLEMLCVLSAPELACAAGESSASRRNRSRSRFAIKIRVVRLGAMLLLEWGRLLQVQSETSGKHQHRLQFR